MTNKGASADAETGSREPSRNLRSVSALTGFDQAREELVDRVAIDIARDARLLAMAPRDLLTRNREEIEEARELLNDALAKVAA